MEAPEGDAARSTPSESYNEVMRCIGELSVARAASSPPQTTENGLGAAVNANACFVTAFKEEWCEADEVYELGPSRTVNGTAPEVLAALVNHELELATFALVGWKEACEARLWRQISSLGSSRSRRPSARTLAPTTPRRVRPCLSWSSPRRCAPR